MVLTGPSRAGKTTVCRAVLEHAAARGIRAAGVLTEDDTAPDGSRLQIVRDLATGERRLLARARSAGQTGPARPTAQGRVEGGGPAAGWTFDGQGVALGQRALRHAMTHGASLLVVDQIGPREFTDEESWTVSFEAVRRGRFDLALMVVNPRVVDQTIERLPRYSIIEVDAETRDELPAHIVARFLPP